MLGDVVDMKPLDYKQPVKGQTERVVAQRLLLHTAPPGEQHVQMPCLFIGKAAEAVAEFVRVGDRIWVHGVLGAFEIPKGRVFSGTRKFAKVPPHLQLRVREWAPVMASFHSRKGDHAIVPVSELNRLAAAAEKAPGTRLEHNRPRLRGSMVSRYKGGQRQPDQPMSEVVK